MKPQFGSIWFIVVVIIVANIAIFYNMSKKLESYVADTMIDNTIIADVNINHGQK